jgi:hypothetical protein
MSILLGFVGYFGLAFFAAVACGRTSGRLSREEEKTRAPEGALNLNLTHHLQIPDASGSKLSVRASYVSSHSRRRLNA